MIEQGVCIDEFETRYRDLNREGFVIEVQRTDSTSNFGVQLELKWELIYGEKDSLAGEYEHIYEGCVNGADIILYENKELVECADLCNEDPDCLGFEYGVDHGGSGTDYSPRDCQLQDSAGYDGCDGKMHNLDLYIKSISFITR